MTTVSPAASAAHGSAPKSGGVGIVKWMSRGMPTITSTANGDTSTTASSTDAVPTGLTPRRFNPPAIHTSATPIATCAAGPSGRMNDR